MRLLTLVMAVVVAVEAMDAVLVREGVDLVEVVWQRKACTHHPF